METIKISRIRMDGGTQPRAELNQDVIDDYASQMSEGTIFPPVTLFYDGKDHWLADGFHRVNAAKQVGFLDISAEVRQGTRRDAILFSVGANSTHGVPRKREDKRRAVVTMLTNPDVMIDNETGKPWSDNKVSKWCNVSHTFVNDLRKSLSCNVARCDEQVRTVERNGTVYTQNTANIGHAKKDKFDDVDDKGQEEINEELQGKHVAEELTMNIEGSNQKELNVVDTVLSYLEYSKNMIELNYKNWSDQNQGRIASMVGALIDVFNSEVK